MNIKNLKKGMIVLTDTDVRALIIKLSPKKEYPVQVMELDGKRPGRINNYVDWGIHEILGTEQDNPELML